MQRSIPPLSLKHSVSAPVCLRNPPPLPPSEYLSLLWLVSSYMPDPAALTTTKAALLNHFLRCGLAAVHKWYKCNSVMSQSHRIKGGTTDEVFQEQYFLWERGTFECTRTDLTHWKGKKTKKQNVSPYKKIINHILLISVQILWSFNQGVVILAKTLIVGGNV